MLVLSVTDCPPALRGDLSRWLLEIDTGVYVGKVSQRVREELWKRVVKHLKNGRAVMVYNARNEQKMDWRRRRRWRISASTMQAGNPLILMNETDAKTQHRKTDRKV